MTLITRWKKSFKNAIIFCRKRIRELLDLQNGDYVTFVVNKDKVQIQNSKTFIEENIEK